MFGGIKCLGAGWPAVHSKMQLLLVVVTVVAVVFPATTAYWGFIPNTSERFSVPGDWDQTWDQVETNQVTTATRL